MSTTPKFSRLAPAQRREQTLDAANALFAERGYDEVSVEDIATSAGVARGLVHHYFGGRKQVYIALLERLGTMREEQLPPPVGRNARARVADNVSRWLDWTEQNRTIWLATLGRGEDIADPDVRARRHRARAPRRRHTRRPPRRHRRRHATAALRARVLDRPQPRRHPPLATRRSHARTDPRTDRLDPRTRPAHLRHSTQATRRLGGEFRSREPLPNRRLALAVAGARGAALRAAPAPAELRCVGGCHQGQWPGEGSLPRYASALRV